MAHAAYPCRLIRLLYVDYERWIGSRTEGEQVRTGVTLRDTQSDRTSTQPSRRSPTASHPSDLSDLSETTKGACLVAPEPRSESDANAESTAPL